MKLAALSLIVALGVTLPAVTLAPASAEAAARAARGQGRVVKAVDLTINGKPASAGALVRSGDRLKTGTGGSADVVLANGAIFRLYPGTEAVIPWTNQKRTLVQLIVGGIMSLVGKPMDYRVKAPKAVAAVGGTCFYMQATPDTPNYVCACSGVVHMGPPRGPATPIDAGFNKHIAVMIGDVGFRPSGAKNHDDQQMWELGKELQDTTGIVNKYKTLKGQNPAEAPPPVEPAPPTP
jgi:ferric-dicitrate binding protein FerR (iron transport regulator)